MSLTIVFLLLMTISPLQCPSNPVLLVGGTNQSEFWPGAGIAMSDDIAVVGFPSEYTTRSQGAVHVFRKKNLQWTNVAVLHNPDIDDFNSFGWSVDVSGDYIVVATSGEKVIVFRHEPVSDTWEFEAVLQEPVPMQGHGFGRSIAICNDIIVVGAPMWTNVIPAAYIFRFDPIAHAWNQQAMLTASASVDHFGESVDVDGDRVIVGSRCEPYGPADFGVANIYRFIEGQWMLEAELRSPSFDGSGYGASVCIEGDTAVVGAPRFETWFSSNDFGAAFVYRHDATWQLESELVPTLQDVGRYFGGSVAIHDGVVAIGQDFSISYSNYFSNRASVALFQRTSGAWRCAGEYRPPTHNDSLFGFQVALNNTHLLAGMPTADFTNEFTGAWLFSLKPPFPDCNHNGWNDEYETDCNNNELPDECDIQSGISPDTNHNLRADECESLPKIILDETQALTSQSPNLFERVGASLAGSPDQLIVGVGGQFVPDLGRIYVFGQTDNQWSLENTIIQPNAHAHGFGRMVARGGDMVVIGAPFDDGQCTLCGAVYVFELNGNVWQLNARLASPQQVNSDLFGRVIATDGERIVVGNTKYSGDVVFIYRRSGSNWVLEATLLPPACAAQFGRSVALDGDRLLVGSGIALGCPSTPYGLAFVYHRTGTSWTLEQTLTPWDVTVLGSYMSSFGTAVTMSNNWIAVSMPTEAGVDVGEGTVYLYKWNGSNWLPRAKLRASDPWREDAFGSTIELNGRWLAVGVPHDDDNGIHSGSVYVFREVLGEQWVEHAKLLASDGARLDQFGSSLAFNGCTIAVGAQYKDGFERGTGAAYTFAACNLKNISDIDGDGEVNVTDLLAVINEWGPCSSLLTGCVADIDPPLNGDGVVGVSDLLAVLSDWN